MYFLNTEHEKDIYMFDSYLAEVQETQGQLFEYIAADSNYDFLDFAEKYILSNLRKRIDDRHPIFCNHFYDELLEDLKKENLEFKSKFEEYSPWMANWVGEFYAYMQCYFHVYSEELLKMFPLDLVVGRYNVLHDYDLGVLAEKLAKNHIICFHNPDEDNAYLSNWYYSDFVLDGIKFNSMEQYMMYSKALLFKDLEVANMILATNDFREIKNLGRRVRGFDDSIWDKYKLEIIYRGLYAKFSQNLDLKEQLLSTGNKLLVECAVNDKIWGAGVSMKSSDRFRPYMYDGRNFLGNLLMKVREDLRNECIN